MDMGAKKFPTLTFDLQCGISSTNRRIQGTGVSYFVSSPFIIRSLVVYLGKSGRKEHVRIDIEMFSVKKRWISIAPESDC